MERVKVTSSNIESVGYDPTMLLLEIEFGSGRVYQYGGVPQHAYERLLAADSKGQYFIEQIRPYYPAYPVSASAT